MAHTAEERAAFINGMLYAYARCIADDDLSGFIDEANVLHEADWLPQDDADTMTEAIAWKAEIEQVIKGG